MTPNEHCFRLKTRVTRRRESAVKVVIEQRCRLHLELFIRGRRSAEIFTPRRSLETSRTDFSNRNRYAICEALSSTSHRPLYIDQQRPSVLPWAPVPSLAQIDVRSAPFRIDLQADRASCDCLRDRHSKWVLVCTLPSPLRRRSRHESIHISRHASEISGAARTPGTRVPSLSTGAKHRSVTDRRQCDSRDPQQMSIHGPTTRRAC